MDANEQIIYVTASKSIDELLNGRKDDVPLIYEPVDIDEFIFHGLNDAQHKAALDLLMEALNGRVSCDQFNNAIKNIQHKSQSG